MIKKIIAGLTLAALVVVPFISNTNTASAAVIDVGNGALNRSFIDGSSNFTVIDVNNPVSANGFLDTFTYFASNTNSFEFVLVDSSNVVKWVGPTITPSAGAGVKTWMPIIPIPASMSWNLGVHFNGTGTIPFDSTGASASFTANGSGLPIVGSTLTVGVASRTYSFGATGTDTLQGTLSAEDFGVVNYDTGLGFLKGYTAGFGLTDATLAGATSVVVKLYSGNTEGSLLQTNTAILSKFNADITGIQFSSPFDVSGTFNYATDGYWTNVRESQYGQSVPATRVVATVTLEDGTVLTAENTTLAGDPTTIYPVVTPPTTPSDKEACKNGGWKTFTNPSFKNQGQCVSAMARS